MSRVCQTIIGIATAKHVVKRSKFLGEASGVNNDAEVKEFVNGVRARIRQATHYCYAYRFENGNEEREFATDAGEPTHSAGPPILNAIRSAGLSNTIIVVARFYGGINLGVGGLSRAYNTCARTCLNNATLETLVLLNNLHINVPHSHVGTVVTLSKRLGAKVKKIQYDPNPNILVQIKHEDLDTFQAQLKSIGITETELL